MTPPYTCTLTLTHLHTYTYTYTLTLTHLHTCTYTYTLTLTEHCISIVVQKDKTCRSNPLQPCHFTLMFSLHRATLILHITPAHFFLSHFAPCCPLSLNRNNCPLSSASRRVGQAREDKTCTTTCIRTKHCAFLGHSPYRAPYFEAESEPTTKKHLQSPGRRFMV